MVMLTEEQARETLRLMFPDGDKLKLWVYHNSHREFVGPEEWGTLTVDRLKTFVQVQQYTEAGDRFRLLGTVTVRAINEQIRRNSDKENQQ